MNPFYIYHQRYLEARPTPRQLPASAPRKQRKQTGWIPFAIVCLVFVLLRFGLLATAGWNSADEAWILQIAERTRSDETLYKDVFFNCTPLAVYLARAWISVTAPEALALKGLCALIEAGIFAATIVFLRALLPKIDWRTPGKLILIGLAMLVIPGPTMAHLYNNLATLLVLVAGISVLKFLAKPTTMAATIVGIVLGLAVGEKQNIGGYLSILSALVMLTALRISLATRAKLVALTAATALGTLTIILLPTLLAGAGHDLLVDTFLMKKQYLAIGATNYWDGFGELARAAGRDSAMGFDVSNFIGHLVFPMSLIAVAGFFVGIQFLATRPALFVAAPFCIVLAAGSYPRADAWHLANAFPAMVIILAVAVSAWSPPVKRALFAGATVIAAAAAFTLVSAAAFVLRSPTHSFSQLPHIRGVLLPKWQTDLLDGQVMMLRKARGPVFILIPEASGMYLVSGVRNPTPWDYPISGELPPNSQERIIAELQSGNIATVIIEGRPWWYSQLFIPERLQTFAEEKCVDVDEWERYRVRRAKSDIE